MGEWQPVSGRLQAHILTLAAQVATGPERAAMLAEARAARVAAQVGERVERAMRHVIKEIK